MDMAQEIERKFLTSGAGPAPANGKRRNSRRYPDYDLPPTESPLSHFGMSGRVYEPVSTVSAIARGAARFRSAKFGGKVVSNAAGSRHRRDHHELQSE